MSRFDDPSASSGDSVSLPQRRNRPASYNLDSRRDQASSNPGVDLPPVRRSKPSKESEPKAPTNRFATQQPSPSDNDERISRAELKRRKKQRAQHRKRQEAQGKQGSRKHPHPKEPHYKAPQGADYSPAYSDEVATPPDLLTREMAQQRQSMNLRRQAKKKRYVKDRVKVGLRLLFLAACALFFWIGLTHSFWNHQLEAMELHPTSYLQEQQIRYNLKPWDGKAMYWINPSELESQLMDAFPLLESVKIRRHLFPARLEVATIEQQPWAVFYRSAKDLEAQAKPYATSTNTYDLIALDAALYEVDELLAQETLIRILASPLYWEALESDERNIQLKRLDYIRQSYQRLPEADLEQIEIDEQGQVSFGFKSFQATLGPLDGNSPQRADRLHALLENRLSVEQTGVPLKTVDLRWKGPVYVGDQTIQPNSIE